MSDPAPRPAYDPTGMTAGFWSAAREHRLVVQRCEDCAELRHYPQPLCPACRGGSWSWTEVSGSGHVYSFTITHQAFHPAWRERLPYAVVSVELDEGVRMICDLPTDDVSEVAIGRRVAVWFDDVDPDLTLPRFRFVD